MRCANCGTLNEDRQRSCGRCGVHIEPGKLQTEVQEQPTARVPLPRTRSAGRSASPADRTPRIVAAALLDLVACVVLLVIGALVATEVARGHAGVDLDPLDLPARFRPIHFGLVAGVVVAYLVGSWGMLGQSAGYYVLVARAPEGTGTALRSLLPAVGLLAAAVLFVGLSFEPTSPSKGETVQGPTAHPSVASTGGSDPAREQAIALNDLLNNSDTSRSTLVTALQSVCGSPGLSRASIQSVLEGREAQLARAQFLPTDALPDGATIRGRLIEAFTHSINADRSFVAYARHVESGDCTPDENLRNGDRVSADATTAKKGFVAVWNPVAQRYGLPARTFDTI
jgi:hypothetical protein